MPAPTPWYEEIDNTTLDQGDILVDCPAGFLPLDWDPDSKEQHFKIDIFSLVVITQACDLAEDKVKYVVCCPVDSHETLDSRPPFRTMNTKDRKRTKDKIIGGHWPGYCMISRHDGDPSRAISVTDFRNVFSLPKSFLLERARERHLRLVTPYREHVSQAFAKFFMRVGLPVEIPKFSG